MMMWYAEIKRIRWPLIRGWDAIAWYGQHLYDQWYNSLTKEQKEELLKRQQQEDKQAIDRFCHMMGCFLNPMLQCL